MMTAMITVSIISGATFTIALYKLHKLNKADRPDDHTITYLIICVFSGICFTFSLPYVIAFGPIGDLILKWRAE